MPDLLRKPFGTHGKVHEITPQSAGWRYVGFSLHRLRAGETAAEATGDREVILVMVEGKAAITGAGRQICRMNPTDLSVTHAEPAPLREHHERYRLVDRLDVTVGVRHQVLHRHQ